MLFRPICLARTNRTRYHEYVTSLSSRSTRKTRPYHTKHPVQPLSLPGHAPSLLPLVNLCNNLDISWTAGSESSSIFSSTLDAFGSPTDVEAVIPFFLSEPRTIRDAVGFVRQSVLSALSSETSFQTRHVHTSDGEHSTKAVMFSPSVHSSEDRTAVMRQLGRKWYRDGVFVDILRGWSDEDFPVWNVDRLKNISSTEVPVAFTVERAMLPLFGFPNYGCLMIAYYIDEQGGPLLWIPRRSLSKRTWPGRLDVTVGGGIAANDDALITIIRECTEEASLPAASVQPFIKPTGVLHFSNRSPAGWILPGVYYLWDLPLPPDGSIRPRPNAADGEVDEFELMNLETVLAELLAGKFKPSSALAVIHWLIKHGYVTEESDLQFSQMYSRLTRPLPLSTIIQESIEQVCT
ncbi:NUDIX hydrolase domain-like protein [Mycena rebaudengoi]|nr:NUDIX hydrolase domain-like protein [Mycena rebaudengoi]